MITAISPSKNDTLNFTGDLDVSSKEDNETDLSKLNQLKLKKILNKEADNLNINQKNRLNELKDKTKKPTGEKEKKSLKESLKNKAIGKITAIPSISTSEQKLNKIPNIKKNEPTITEIKSIIPQEKKPFKFTEENFGEAEKKEKYNNLYDYPNKNETKENITESPTKINKLSKGKEKETLQNPFKKKNQSLSNIENKLFN